MPQVIAPHLQNGIVKVLEGSVVQCVVIECILTCPLFCGLFQAPPNPTNYLLTLNSDHFRDLKMK